MSSLQAVAVCVTYLPPSMIAVEKRSIRKRVSQVDKIKQTKRDQNRKEKFGRALGDFGQQVVSWWLGGPLYGCVSRSGSLEVH